MVKKGERCPGFELPGTDGDEITEYRLEDFLDDGVVCLVFYPFDFSPVCHETLCTFRDTEFMTFTEDVDALGISTDSAYAHKKFIEANDFPFPLLSDNDGSVCDQYDVLYDECEGHNRVSKRALLVVDETQTVQFRWEAEDEHQACGRDVLREAKDKVDAFPTSPE